MLPHDAVFLSPDRPRKNINIESLSGLATSIKNNGIIQPLVVKRICDDKYELISGERRLTAAKSVGLETVPCIVMAASESDSIVYSLIENLQRDDLNFFEIAEALNSLIYDYGVKQENIYTRLGKSQPWLSNKLRLLNLSDELRDIVLKNNLTERHARALLKIKDNETRLKALNYIAEKGLNVNETDRYIEQLIKPVQIRRTMTINKLKDIKIFINTINHVVETMRKAGINADSHENETSDYYEYIVRIPKMTSSPVNISEYSGDAV